MTHKRTVPIPSELRSRVRQTVRRYCDEPSLRDAAFKALTRPGFALHPEARGRAGLVCLESYRAVHGALDGAGWAAASAAELYMEAGFLFDNVADKDVVERGGSSESEELALALTLMNCGTAAACEAAADGGADCARVLRLLSRHTVAATAGQFLDARLETTEQVTTDDAITMTSLKSGGCGRLATSLGAGVARAEPEIIDLFGDFGFNLFTCFQLIDDVKDASPPNGGRGDIEQNKKTVPLVFFRNSMDPDAAATNGIIDAGTSDRNSNETHLRFKVSGAPEFVAIIAEAYLNRAMGNLAELSGVRGGVGNLESLVDSIEISQQGVLISQ